MVDFDPVKLHQLHHDDRFDLVVVDTPPSRNALDFLDAPGTLSRFLDHPVFKLMMLPARRGLKVLNLASQPLLRAIGKVVGGEVLADAVAFFQAFAGMETGFRDRADEVMRLLSSPVTRFVLIASVVLAIPWFVVCWWQAERGHCNARLAMKVVTGADLLAQLEYLGMESAFIALTDGDFDAPPTYENLGATGHIYYGVLQP